MLQKGHTSVQYPSGKTKFQTTSVDVCAIPDHNTRNRFIRIRPPPPPRDRLKLRTVVSIAPEGPMEDEAMFCREHSAQLVPVRAELYREEAVTVSCQQVAQVLADWLTTSVRIRGQERGWGFATWSRCCRCRWCRAANQTAHFTVCVDVPFPAGSLHIPRTSVSICRIQRELVSSSVSSPSFWRWGVPASVAVV